jgi:Predicted membrane protein (DUF2142)
MRRSGFGVVGVLLLGSLLVGLAHVALLPPFEGFDETGHYSYLQQLAETGRWPVRGDRMSKDIDDYLAVAPAADSMGGRWRYEAFFKADSANVDAGRRTIKAPPQAPRVWAPGQVENWQSQHPPLYYLLLAPAYLASKSWSLGAQLLFLRSLSYLIAWAGLCVVAIALTRRGRPDDVPIGLPFAIAVWPALFPMWFPEMGRLGNDSLITFFAAAVFILAWRVTSSATLRDHAALGAVLGLALLTKATFLPVTAALLAVLAIQMLRARKDAGEFSRRLAGLLVATGILLAVGGWWYVLKFMETGTLIGSADAINMRAAGGMIAGLTKNLHVEDLLATPLGFLLSFVWGGTWSFIMPPRVAYPPFALMMILMAYGVWRAPRRRDASPVVWFALGTVALFIVALGYQSLVTLSVGNGSFAAWYLHSMAPVLALLVCIGIAGVAEVAWLRRTLVLLWFYPPLFLLVLTITNALYFAGCSAKLPERMYYSAARAIECLADVPRMSDNLAVLAFPGIGVALFAAGWIAMVAGLIRASCRCRSPSDSSCGTDSSDRR